MSFFLFPLVNEWEKRFVISNKEKDLRNFPSVLTYIAGRKHEASVVKVFLRNEDEDAKEYFENQDCSKYRTFEFINLSNKTTKVPGSTRKEDNRNIPLPMDAHTRRRLGKIIEKHGEKLMAKHSSIRRISPGYMSKETHFGEPCIVLFCLDNILIPFGETKMPESLEGFPVDIREEFVESLTEASRETEEHLIYIGDIEEKEYHSLPALAFEETSQFKSISEIMLRYSSVGEVLGNNNIKRFVNDLSSLSTKILLRKEVNLETNALRAGSVSSLEVEVTFENNELKVAEKNPNLADTFFESIADFNPGVILVTSYSISTVEAKLAVFRKYKDVLSLPHTFIHHVYEKTGNLLNLSVFYKASYFYEKIQVMTTTFSRQNLLKLTSDVFELVFEKEHIIQECFKTCIRTNDLVVGTVNDNSHYCESKSSFNQLRQILVEEIVKTICKTFGYSICHGLTDGRPDLTTLQLLMLSDIYERIAVKTVKVDVKDDSNWTIFLRNQWHINVNSRKWRNDIANAIWISIHPKKERFLDLFVENCIKTKLDLQTVCKELESLQKLSQPIHLKAS